MFSHRVRFSCSCAILLTIFCLNFGCIAIYKNSVAFPTSVNPSVKSGLVGCCRSPDLMLGATTEADTLSYYRTYCGVTVTRLRDIYSIFMPQDRRKPAIVHVSSH